MRQAVLTVWETWFCHSGPEYKDEGLMLGRSSWLDVVFMASLRYSTPKSRFEVELKGPTRLSNRREEILTTVEGLVHLAILKDF